MGVAVAVFALRVVLQSQLLCHMGVAITIIMPHVVSQVPSLCHMWFHGCGGWP